MRFLAFFQRKPATPQGTQDRRNLSAVSPQKTVLPSLTECLKGLPITTFAGNDPILEDSRHVDSLWVIVDGEVSLRMAASGWLQTLHFTEGEALGFLTGGDESVLYSINAKTPSALVRIDREQFAHMAEQTKIRLYERLHDSWSKIHQHTITDLAQSRVNNAKLLLKLSKIEQKKREITSSKLIQNVIDCIPKLPAYTADLLAKLLNEHTSIHEVTDIIRKDPPLAGAILRNVNSAYYGLQRKIASIHHAIAYLGCGNIYRIVMNDFMKNILPDEEDFCEIQNHSILISIIAQEIASGSQSIKSANPTTIGILHDIGKIVILLLKKKYPDMSEIMDMLDDAIIGARLLERWELPDNVYRVVESQHLPEVLPPEDLPREHKDDIAVLYMAHTYCDWLTNHTTVSTVYLDAYFSLLQMPAYGAQKYYDDVLLPALGRNKQRLPATLRNVLALHTH